jgi:hypothetical protein
MTDTLPDGNTGIVNWLNPSVGTLLTTEEKSE